MGYGYGYGGWAPYVPVAKRRQQAEREVAKLRKKDQTVSPVTVEGRAIARTFWGKAWCDNMESYHDYESRLPRGRTYVRNGSVIDLQVAPLEIRALVSGSEIYRVSVSIKALPAPQWKSICRDCAGGIDSLVELLQGRFSKGVMERLCRQDKGLFPKPSEIRFSCSCPDGAYMCKHVAAVLYGVGARLDRQPELLFRLRAVDENDLVPDLDASLPFSTRPPAAGKVLETDDLSALFGLDLGSGTDDAPTPPTRPKPQSRKAAKTPEAADPAELAPPRRSRPASKRAKAPEKQETPVPKAELTPEGFVKWWK